MQSNLNVHQTKQAKKFEKGLLDLFPNLRMKDPRTRDLRTQEKEARRRYGTGRTHSVDNDTIIQVKAS